MADENSARAREIVETASRLFAASGFDGVSVRDICSELSVNCSIVSYYFGGKKGLYLEVLRSQFTAYGRALESVVVKNMEPREILSVLIDTMREFQATNPYFSAIVTRESGCPSPEFVQAVEEYENKFGDKLAEIVRSGQRQGAFKPNFKISALTLAINMLLNGSSTASLCFSIQSTFTENDYFETIKTILLDGIMADPAAENGWAIGKQSAKPRNTFGR
ncbi:hypothetical protein C4J81_11220 [Deltaproteobacteria bacterium Smac51]|nr:hypothetical protein C4J81_11220 [Deltaproteobacteria bacterium Smac51]